MKHKSLEKTLALAHVALALSGVVLLIALTIGAVKISDALVGTVNRASAVVGNADSFINSTQKRLDGTFQNANAILIQAGLAADEIRRTSISERGYLSTISKETVATMKHANQSLEDLDGTIKTAKQTVSHIDTETLPAVNTDLIAVGSAVNKMGGAVDGLTLKADAVLTDAHVLLSNPALVRTEENVQTATKDVAADLAPTAGNFWHRLWDLFFPGHPKGTK